MTDTQRLDLQGLLRALGVLEEGAHGKKSIVLASNAHPTLAPLMAALAPAIAAMKQGKPSPTSFADGLALAARTTLNGARKSGDFERLTDMYFAGLGYRRLERRGVGIDRIYRYHLVQEIKRVAAARRVAQPFLTHEAFTFLADTVALLAVKHSLHFVGGRILGKEHEEKAVRAVTAWGTTSKGLDSQWNTIWDLCDAFGLSTTENPKDIARDVAKLERLLRHAR